MPKCTVTLLVRWAELANAALSHFVHTPIPPPPTTLLTTTISRHSSGTLPEVAVCLCTAPLRSAQGYCHTAGTLGEASTSFPLSYTNPPRHQLDLQQAHSPQHQPLTHQTYSIWHRTFCFAIDGGIAKCTSPLSRSRYSGPSQLILLPHTHTHTHTSSLTPA